jgi:hypothetical protein
LPKTVDFGKITNDQLEIFHEGFGKDFYGDVMLHGDNAKLKNQSWIYDTPLFQSGLHKTTQLHFFRVLMNNVSQKNEAKFKNSKSCLFVVLLNFYIFKISTI